MNLGLAGIQMMLTLPLIFRTISSICYSHIIINVANRVYSTKAESDGLHLSSTFIFRSIDLLIISLHFTLFSVFVYNQITVGTTVEFWTKLQITCNDDGLTNAGSLVGYYTQNSKTATGYRRDYFEPGHYTFEVHYKSSISLSTSTEYQTAILWLADAHAVSYGVKCYPLPYPINRYFFSPVKDLKKDLWYPLVVWL